ncbi:Crp/Fnr family transcriptional regulator [Leptothoe spongobia]|uniref:Crp/Fnr family transcriptional regulator n=1 Tax=Leptothoe spongobia TAU-MAC 1115 TaxID=1967444 RepID=A0A947DIZ4_9CYAN|nr:Crp/Fnr family transcriptional regulator [Leptothoe spongobia]MBT9317843.1 Crp/Fnr family transcriptional regulator [Leptothoe spongobia TAU-MAC 1115]
MSSSLLQSYRFKRRDRISVDTYTLWQVRSGLVRTVTWSEEGEVVPLGLWSPGSVIGVPISQIEPCELQCLSAVELSRLPLDYPLTVEMLLQHTAQVNRLLQIMHCRQVQGRLLQFSCWLAENFGQPTSHGRLITVRLTHQEIAESIGTSRVTVTRFIKQLEVEGLMRWSGRERFVSNQALKAHQRELMIA